MFQAMKHFDLANFIQMVSPTVVTVVCLFLLCHFGSYLSEHFDHFGNAVYQLNWYMLPLKQKRLLPTFLALINKPTPLEGYGGTQCTCQSFTQVSLFSIIVCVKRNFLRFTESICIYLQIMKTTCSYFIVLQEFY